MNKIYKTVFNKKTGQLVAVQETASAHGQGGSTVTAAHSDNALAAAFSGLSLKPLLHALCLAFMAVPMVHAPAVWAAPAGASVQAGTASITQQGLATQITNSPGAVIN